MTTTDIKVIEYLKKLLRPGYYGSLTVGIQNGQIKHIKEERAIKPDEL